MIETTSSAGSSARKDRVFEYSTGLRVLISVFGGWMVGVVLYRMDAGVGAWLTLAAWSVAWPIAVWWMLRRRDRSATARRHYLLGELAGGCVLVVLMQGNLLPGVLLLVACIAGTIALGDKGLWWRAPLWMALGVAVGIAIGGPNFSPRTDAVEMLAALPVLVILPLSLAMSTSSLAQRMLSQSQKLHRVSRVDSLCGLLNRGCWEERVNSFMQGPIRSGAMLVMDIDHFKDVNDTWGHTTGDEAIAKVGAIIDACVRGNDVAGRYGGDEFAVMLHGADVQIALVVAERIRKAVAESTFEGAPGLRCTMSIGIAPHDARMNDARDWVNTADSALYRAKHAGRDRCMVSGWPPSLVEPQAEPGSVPATASVDGGGTGTHRAAG